MNSNGIASQLIIDILANQMGLDASSQIWLRDQNVKIPNDDGLYIVVGMVDSDPITANSRIEEATDAQNNTTVSEINEVQARELVQVEVVSRSTEALFRNWEVIAALRSIYSRQSQEKNDFKICRLPARFLNISHAEGGSVINRYALTFSCFVWYRKSTVLSSGGGLYYDDFTTREDNEKTIGTATPAVEFEINEGGIVS